MTCLLLLALAIGMPAMHVHAAEVVVFAAASLKPALDAIIATPQGVAIGEIKASYAASSQLARQIEHDAPAALFISADTEWMDYVEQRGKLIAGTRSDLLGNALVLVAASDNPITLSIVPGFDLAAALGADGRLAIGEPNSVPAGKYAKAALTSLGVWSQIEPRIAPAVHVRAALSYVAHHEAPLGVVYRSDAVSEKTVRVVDTFSATSHPPIVYPIALLKGGDNETSRALLALLQSGTAAAIFTRYGFDVLPRR